MMKDDALAVDGDDQPYVFEESPSCVFHICHIIAPADHLCKSFMEKCARTNCRV